MCAKTDTTLIWLHHTNKSSSGSSHRAGGSTDVIEIISAAHELKHTWDEKTESGSTEWIVQKIRGSSKRRFSYRFDFETGVVLDDLEPEPAATGDLILRAIYESENKRLTRQSIADRISKDPKTLSNHATHLRSKGLIRSHRTAWELTKKGVLAAKDLQPLPSLFPAYF
jgi:RecA-family ATPase